MSILEQCRQYLAFVSNRSRSPWPMWTAIGTLMLLSAALGFV